MIQIGWSGWWGALHNEIKFCISPDLGTVRGRGIITPCASLEKMV